MSDYFNNDKDDFNVNFKFVYQYRGLVVDDRDPRDVGRVKVRVEGVYPKTVPDSDLPWAIPALSLYRSGGDNSRPSMSSEDAVKNGFNNTGTGGIFTVPKIGTHVWIFFDRGNHMYPVYWAASPGDSDWLTQKIFAKEKIQKKIEQIKKFKNKFTPVNSFAGTDGIDWADGAHVNSRVNISSKDGQRAPYGSGSVGEIGANEGTSEIINKTDFDPRNLHIDNADLNGEKSKNMSGVQKRTFGSALSLDIKPLFDKEDTTGNIDRKTLPHKIDETVVDDAEENNRNINRYITSFTTVGGTTVIVDNREGQENFYLIHKNYIFNVDEEGSAKEFCGKNDPDDKPLSDEKMTSVNNKVRANKEIGVEGDYKIHVLGNFVTYTKGNVFMQVDKNMQIDVNDTYGMRVRKGDVDIVIEGETEDTSRDKDSEREDGKKSQQGDLNIAIKKGHMEIYVGKNANIHVGDQCNLKVDGDMKVHVGKSYHLHVEGDYNEYIVGNKYSTVKKEREIFVGGNKKEFIGKSSYVDITEENNTYVGQKVNYYCSGIVDYIFDSTLRIQTPSVHMFGSNLYVSNNIFTTTTNLNTYRDHYHIGVQPGAGPSGPPKSDMQGSENISEPDIDNMTIFQIDDIIGSNSDTDDQNTLDGPSSDKISTSFTKKAKRRYDSDKKKRPPKKSINSSIFKKN